MSPGARRLLTIFSGLCVLVGLSALGGYQYGYVVGKADGYQDCIDDMPSSGWQELSQGMPEANTSIKQVSR